MVEVYNYLIDFGFKREDIDIIINTYPLNELVPSTLLKHIKENNDYFLNYGYNKSQIIKMVIKLPQLFCYNVENIKQKIDDLISLGYTKEQVKKMTILTPALYGYNILNIKQKIIDLISLGYTELEAKKMLKTMPTMFCYNNVLL